LKKTYNITIYYKKYYIMTSNLYGLLLIIIIFGGLLLLMLVGYLIHLAYKKIKEKKNKDINDNYFFTFY